MILAARRALAAAALAGVSGLASGAAPATLPPAALSVQWGSNAGSDSFRSDFTHALADALGRACLSRIVVVEDAAVLPETPLRVSIVLSDVVDEIEFEDTLAGTLQSEDPGHELRRVARYEVSMDAALETTESGALIRHRRSRAHVYRRPMVLGEDPRAYAQGEVIEDLVKEVKKGICKDGEKLARDVDAALAGAAEDAGKR